VQKNKEGVFMGKTINIVLSGEAGEGLKTIEKLITDVVSKY